MRGSLTLRTANRPRQAFSGEAQSSQFRKFGTISVDQLSYIYKVVPFVASGCNELVSVTPRGTLEIVQALEDDLYGLIRLKVKGPGLIASALPS
jgi:hypothetical protein